MPVSSAFLDAITPVPIPTTPLSAAVDYIANNPVPSLPLPPQIPKITAALTRSILATTLSATSEADYDALTKTPAIPYLLVLLTTPPPRPSSRATRRQHNRTLLQTLKATLTLLSLSPPIRTTLSSELHTLHPLKPLTALLSTRPDPTTTPTHLHALQLLVTLTTHSDAWVVSVRNNRDLVRKIIDLSSMTVRRRWWGTWGRRFDNPTAVQGTANKLLAVLGYNKFIPRTRGQRGLRILALDGGGSRGVVTLQAIKAICEKTGKQPWEYFDMIVGTSTGAIISFLVALKLKNIDEAIEKYDELVPKIFEKSSLPSAMQTAKQLITTASYSEEPFQQILKEILGETSMVDSRFDPKVPLVFAVASKMTSNPTKLVLFRNYNYAVEGRADKIKSVDEEVVVEVEEKSFLDNVGGVMFEEFNNLYSLTGPSLILNYTSAVEGDATYLDTLEQPAAEPVEDDEEEENKVPWYFPDGRCGRHDGSFRVLARVALRASTAAPTIFKPVLMDEEFVVDGGVAASNPAAVALHEASCVYPNVPVELLISCGTGGFVEEKMVPKLGWDAIIGQIVNSATDGEATHEVLLDLLPRQGKVGALKRLKRKFFGSGSVRTKYYRFNPQIGLPNDYAIDETDPKLLARLKEICAEYMSTGERVKWLDEIKNL